MQLHRLVFAAFFGAFANADVELHECISGLSHLYSGEKSMTADGIPCQRWDIPIPHKPMHVPLDGGHHNFCRNPSKDMKGTWCYTVDPEIRWGYCGIAKCSTDALIKWNSVDEFRNTSYFSKVNADLEDMAQKAVRSGDETTNSESWENAQFETFDTNFEQKLLYFTDVRGNYFGIYHSETEAMEKFLQGMAENIKAISYDWVTNNFYWTDSRLMSIMVADSSLQSYTTVYKPAQGYTPYALEVHSVKKRLIFSTFMRKNVEEIDAKIIYTDLSGGDEKVLFEYPEVVKVVALTVDYVEDRIYWIEDLVYGSKIVSSSVDGRDKAHVYTGDDRFYYDLTVYSDYVYASDTRKRYNMMDELRYHVQVITKNSNQLAHYKTTEKPMGIASYVKNDFFSSTKEQRAGECIDKCDGICLPALEGKHKCACSFGFHLQSETGECIAQLLDDEYLLAVDANEGHAYQISFTSDDYSIAPLGKASQITSAVVDPGTKFAFFSDARSGSVSRGILGVGQNTHLANFNARYIEVDPLTGNVFYTDGKTITVSSADGKAKFVVVKMEANNDIKAFALDIKEKYLYWTNTFSQIDAGKLMRCRFDGTRKQVVLANLNLPHGITIDISANLLYFVESKNGTVHAIPLRRFVRNRSTSVKDVQRAEYDLKTSLESEKFLLTEIKVHNGIAYVVDETQAQIQQFSLIGSATLSGFGPSIFYRAASLSVYSKSESVYQNIQNPCKRKKFCSLCVDRTKKQAKCLRRNGMRKVSRA